jgi:predicted RecB family nuclease
MSERMLGAYAAVRCAVRTQWDVVRPREAEPDEEFHAWLAAAGRTFEGEVMAALRAAHPDAVDVGRDAPAEEREARTLAALHAGARLVLHPRLPVDTAGGRVGEPDLLVRGRDGYHPVDVKHHRTISDADAGDLRGVQPLDGLDGTSASARPRDARPYERLRDDLLQLAHYRRLLEACGQAAAAPVLGAIIGRERHVVWLDLAAPRVPASDDSGMVSALDAYDAEYAARRRIAAEAAAHVVDPSDPLPLAPVRIAECPRCPWRVHCGDLLEARQDVSLLPRVGRAQWEALARIGADTIPALAAWADDTPVEGLTDKALAAAIEQARARLGPAPAYRRRGVERVEVVGADVELDIDMENVGGGAYLWGVWVGGRAAEQIAPPGYRCFVDWDADAAAAGVRAFEAFWTWLDGSRAEARARGLTLRAYCWSAAAENRWLRHGAAAIGRSREVERFIASPEWVDLMAVFDRNVLTGHGIALKSVAYRLGFFWDDEDPDGAQSMLWWQDATAPDVDAQLREDQRERLLAYNRDDVRATSYIRDWLRREGRSLDVAPRPD